MSEIIKIEASDIVPPNQAWLVDGNRILGRIINIGYETQEQSASLQKVYDLKQVEIEKLKQENEKLIELVAEIYPYIKNGYTDGTGDMIVDIRIFDVDKWEEKAQAILNKEKVWNTN